MGNSVDKTRAAQNDTRTLRPPESINANWNQKYIKKLIESKKLAPFFAPIDDEDATPDAEECPICLNYYIGGLNRGKCCGKGLCTVCYLQIKKTPELELSCPFCMVSDFEISFYGPKTLEEIQMEAEEQKKVTDLLAKMRLEEIEADRARELKKQQQRRDASPCPPSSLPTSSSPSISSRGDHSSYGTSPGASRSNFVVPKTPPNSPAPDCSYLPQSILDLQQAATTAEERDYADLQAAIWLSLNPDAPNKSSSNIVSSSNASTSHTSINSSNNSSQSNTNRKTVNSHDSSNINIPRQFGTEEDSDLELQSESTVSSFSTNFSHTTTTAPIFRGPGSANISQMDDDSTMTTTAFLETNTSNSESFTSDDDFVDEFRQLS